MKYFCFCIPVRLGVLIISGLSILGNFVPMMLFLLHSAEEIKSETHRITKNFKAHEADAQDKEIYEIIFELAEDCEYLVKCFKK
jgi:hypothetical protein